MGTSASPRPTRYSMAAVRRRIDSHWRPIDGFNVEQVEEEVTSVTLEHSTAKRHEHCRHCFLWDLAGTDDEVLESRRTMQTIANYHSRCPSMVRPLSPAYAVLAQSGSKKYGVVVVIDRCVDIYWRAFADPCARQEKEILCDFS